MEVPVINQNGETVQTIELDDAVFNVPMNHSLVHQALIIYQLNKRQGTHDTKTRAQVSGGGRKPWVQKHTGRARQGSIRSPQWRHGGVVFGPHPRDYRKALPRRMRHLALKCVLSDKARQHRLVCLDSMDRVDGKTKSMVELLNNLGISSSALLVTLGSEQKVARAAHNLQKIWTLPVSLLNAHELLRRDIVIITLEAARWAEQFLVAAACGRRALEARIASANTGAESPGPNGAVAVAEAVEEAAAAPDLDQASEEEAGA
jgi:large subunit ribosomal protein L4